MHQPVGGGTSPGGGVQGLRQIYAIVVVIGFAGFWTFGFIGLSELLGAGELRVVHFVLCLVGLAVGLWGWRRIDRLTPRMHGKRAAARARLEEELSEHAG